MPVQSVPIDLNGERHELRYDFRALAALEKKFSVSIGEIGQKLSGSVRIEDLKTLIWAGLLHENKTITEDRAEELLAGENIIYVSKKLAEAMNAAFKSSEVEVEKN